MEYIESSITDDLGTLAVGDTHGSERGLDVTRETEVVGDNIHVRDGDAREGRGRINGARETCGQTDGSLITWKTEEESPLDVVDNADEDGDVD